MDKVLGKALYKEIEKSKRRVSRELCEMIMDVAVWGEGRKIASSRLDRSGTYWMVVKRKKS